MTTQRLTHNNRTRQEQSKHRDKERGGEWGEGGKEAKPVPAGKLSRTREGREGWAREAQQSRKSWQGARRSRRDGPWRIRPNRNPGGWPWWDEPREDPAKQDTLEDSQGGTGGTNQGGSGLTRSLEDGQGGAGGTDQAGSSLSGGQGGASSMAGCQGGPGRTGSLGGTGRARHLRGAGRTRNLGGAGRARRLGGSGRRGAWAAPQGEALGRRRQARRLAAPAG